MFKTILERPVTVLMIFIAISVFGIISYFKLPVNLLPNIKYPSVTIWTEYLNASPEQIEKDISMDIEAKISTVDGIKNVESSSKDGISLIKASFQWGTNMDFAVLSIREKLDAVTLPDLAGRPNIIRIDPSEKPVIGLAVTGENLYEVRMTAENIIKRRLEQLDGIALADVEGGEDKNIEVIVDLGKIKTYKVNIEDVKQAIKKANIDQSGGSIKEDYYVYDLKITSEYTNVDDIKNTLVVQTEDFRNIYIKDVAEVKVKNKDKKAFTRFNGRESIGVLVRKESSANAVSVSQSVKSILKELKQDLDDINIYIAFDNADFIEDSIDNVVSAIIIGGLLAFFTLFLFLKNLKSPLNISISIPVSILAAISFIYLFNISLNIMTLSGLALGVGMLVDNSIVILENIMRYYEKGISIYKACYKGTKEVAMPVTASTLTTIIVFMPVVFVSGVTGELFKDQSLSVVFSLVSSLIVSLTLLPVVTSKINSKWNIHKFVKNSESLESTKGVVYKAGTYWILIFLISYIVFNINEWSILYKEIIAFIYSQKPDDTFSFLKDLNNLVYIMFLGIICDSFFKFIEFFLLKKSNQIESSTSIFRFFLVQILVLIISICIFIPAVYTSRVDFFDIIFRIFNFFGINGVFSSFENILYELSYFIKDLMIPYEENWGSVMFSLVIYSVSFILMILYLFGIFELNFLKKLSKNDILEIRKIEKVRKKILFLVGLIFVLFLGIIKYWIRILFRFIKFLFYPILLSFDFIYEKFRNLYHEFLEYGLKNPYKIVMLSLSLLLFSVIFFLTLEKRLMPQIDSGSFILDVELDPGTDIMETENLLISYENICLQDSDIVESVYTSGGIPDEKSKISGSTSYKGNLLVNMKPGENTFNYVNKLRKKIQKFNKNYYLRVKTSINTDVSTLSEFIRVDDADISIKLSGEDLSILSTFASEIKDSLYNISNLSDIKMDFKNNKPKVKISFKNDFLQRENIPIYEVENFLKLFVSGDKVSEFDNFNEKMDIFVIAPDIENIAEIEEKIFIYNEKDYSLGSLINISYTIGPESIQREDQKRIITILANIKNGNFNTTISDINNRLQKISFYKGYKYEIKGQNEEMENSFKQLIFMFLLSVLLVYMVLASQFESLLSPFIIMFSVPMAIFGSLLGLFIFDMSLNVMSVIGIIILIGIVVNDAIVKVDFIDNQIKQGKKIKEAIITAGEQRLRPILMTTISTVFGMIPMAIGFGKSAELRQPLAITVIFGLSFATLLTLIIIPVIYFLLKRNRYQKVVDNIATKNEITVNK